MVCRVCPTNPREAPGLDPGAVHTFTPAIFHACHLVQPSNEYDISDAIDLLIHSGRIDAIRMDGWRIDVGYPEGRDEAATAESE